MIHIKIKGNIESIKASTLAELELLYDLAPDRSVFLPLELVDALAIFTGKINREIAVYLNRKGNITEIIIGDGSTVTLSELEGRKGKTRLSGTRCVHTHPNGDGMLSAVDISSLFKMNLDAMIAIGVKDGETTEIYAALPSVLSENRDFKPNIYGPFDKSNLDMDFLFERIFDIDKAAVNQMFADNQKEEKAILVGLEMTAGNIINGKSEAERSLEELEELSSTAGLVVIDKILQKRTARDSALYIGRGKIEQIGLMVQALDADTLVFDDELSGAQIRNIENATGAKVLDRTTLILDIFAQRAHSSEGKLQVELAQLKYRLPRLTGLGGQLSRLGGGIGTRGPGEKKLETDRRHIRRRISSLEDELGKISKRRGLMREERRDNSEFVLALVGYTNSGKSTLLNKLCDAEVFAEDKLFATLDPTIRKLILPDERHVLLVDTVGFIKKLPHELIDAFKSTLEEVVFADMLLHVVDASDPEAEEQIPVVEEILKGLGAYSKTTLLVFNKMDIAEDITVSRTAKGNRKSIEVSAVTGQGLDELLKNIVDSMPAEEENVSVLAPYNRGWILPYMHENGKVINEEYLEDGIKITARVKIRCLDKIRDFIIDDLTPNKL